MKRYRVIPIDFDGRAATLEPIQEQWDEQNKILHRQNQERLLARLKSEFGEHDFEAKLENFKSLGIKPVSVVAFHNRFFDQSRKAFVFGQYYPALTAVCALGERVLNHLMLSLRDNYKSHAIYKKIYQKDSFDNWPIAIEALKAWNILTPEAATSFDLLNKKRNAALHFNLSTEANDKQLAFEAIKNFEDIITHQFSGFGTLPWLLPSPGECYIKKDFESSPFIQLVYIPNCVHLGYKHSVTRVFPWEFQDFDDYPDQEVSDDEFVHLRQKFQQR